MNEGRDLSSRIDRDLTNAGRQAFGAPDVLRAGARCEPDVDRWCTVGSSLLDSDSLRFDQGRQSRNPGCYSFPGRPGDVRGRAVLHQEIPARKEGGVNKEQDESAEATNDKWRDR